MNGQGSEFVQRNTSTSDRDRSIAEGNVPTLDDFMLLCRDRATNIRDEQKRKPTGYSPALYREAKRLDKAGNGDYEELVAEARNHAE